MENPTITHEDKELINCAIAVLDKAYAPYSRFPVGAALVCENGEVFVGCNVENLSFSLTQCAEKVAVSTAVTAGNRKFKCIAIVADTVEVISPCGACRQVLAEFNPHIRIISANKNGDRQVFLLDDLLPRPATGILNNKTA